MNRIKYIGFLFFNYYYNGRSRDIAYIRTIASLTIFTYLHFILLLLVFDKTDLILSGGTITDRYRNAAIGISPFFLFYLFTIKRQELLQMKFDESKIKNDGWKLVIYLIIIFVLFSVMAFLRKGK